MNFIKDFVAGRTHKLARDFLASSLVIVCLCLGGMMLIGNMLKELKVATRQPLPSRTAATQPSNDVRTTTVIRSVLDGDVTTASVGKRTIVLDPCTGKEK